MKAFGEEELTSESRRLISEQIDRLLWQLTNQELTVNHCYYKGLKPIKIAKKYSSDMNFLTIP
jgi:hypothetical protein